MTRWDDTTLRSAVRGARQIRLILGVFAVLSLLGAARVVYAWPAADRWAAWLVGLTGLLLAGVQLLPWRRLVTHRALPAALTIGFAAALLALFAFTLPDRDAEVIFPSGTMMIIVAAATTAGPRQLIGLGGLGLAGLVGLAAAMPEANGLLVVSSASVMTVVVGLCALTAHHRRQQDAERTAAAHRTGALLEHGSDAVLAIGDGGVRFVSSSTGRILGRDADTLTPEDLVEMTHPDQLVRVQTWLAELRDGEPGATARIESLSRHADGRFLDVEVTGTNRLDDPDIRAVILSIRDVSAQKALQAELSRQAYADPLTGLPNRILLHDRVGHAVERNRRDNGRVSLLLIDLDDFKKVNDTLGHGAGDVYLRTIATRMAAAMRPADTLARLGGDEFAVLVEGLDELELADLADRLLEVVRMPVRAGHRDLVSSASIGAATVKSGEEDAETVADELLRDADLAMYSAKTGGRDRYAVYDPSMYAAAVREAEERGDLERGLAHDEFVVHYQPIVDLPTSRLIGVEALARWHHPVEGLLSPDRFIPVAEATGLIVPLGLRMLQMACAQVAEWHRSLPGAEGMRVSINLSARQFQDDRLVDNVRGVLTASGIDPGLVVLEITESMLMHDIDATVEILDQLRGLGLRIAIDDFGTGYSSLSYLRRFPIDILKIDKAFVDGIATHPDDATLAEAVVGLGRALRLQTVAEGIEDIDQHSLLTDLGCTYGQGYLFARPASSVDIEQFIRDGHRAG